MYLFRIKIEQKNLEVEIEQCINAKVEFLF